MDAAVMSEEGMSFDDFAVCVCVREGSSSDHVA